MAVGSGGRSTDEHKRFYDAEMSRLRVARQAAIAEINRSFDSLERELQSKAPAGGSGGAAPVRPVTPVRPPSPPVYARDSMFDSSHPDHPLTWANTGDYRCDSMQSIIPPVCVCVCLISLILTNMIIDCCHSLSS